MLCSNWFGKGLHCFYWLKMGEIFNVIDIREISCQLIIGSLYPSGQLGLRVSSKHCSFTDFATIMR